MRRIIDEAVFHITPDETTGAHDAIPFARAIEIMQGLQDVIIGLADTKITDAADGRSVLRPAGETQQHYQLFLKPAQTGCYAMAFELVDTRSDEENAPQTAGDDEIGFTDVDNIIEMVTTNSVDAFRQKCSSRVVANKILDGVEKILPADGEVLYFDTKGRDGSSRRTYIESKTRDNVLRFRAEPDEPETVELYGTIVKVDFEAQRLSVKLNGSHKKQDVKYDLDLEGRTLHDIREQQQKLTCSVTYSPNGQIEHINKVEAMSALELRTIKIDSFGLGGRVIQFKKCLELKEQIDVETGSMIYVACPELSIRVYAECQEDMEELIRDELANKWEWLVESDDEELTKDAIDVKNRFLNLVKED